MVNSAPYLMPAEWEPHRAVWLAWPHDEISFPGPHLAGTKSAIAKIISAIHQTEQVELLVVDEPMQREAAAALKAAGVALEKITFRQTSYMDAWMRDCGPIFVKDRTGNLSLVKWIFNMWGNKFPDLLPDDQLPYRLRDWLGLAMREPQLVLEGGAIDVNGQGLCLTTEQCLLNENRNGGKTKKDIEQFLAENLGISKTIWLWKGLMHDHTDGHVDEIARFIGPNRVVCAYDDDPASENYAILKNNYETLCAATDQDGQPLEVIKLPMPHLRYDQDKPFEQGEVAPVSYTNFYIGNGMVLAAVFSDPNDQKALDILKSCFPGRQVVPIDCTDIIYGGGAIHCITQQEPGASVKREVQSAQGEAGD
ncbi:MAG TPA: agmatine deiminase family protein [Patescibacteria group bacterium]|nr:agmatine deiminase family protein [Patescibacteria group bacterium]